MGSNVKMFEKEIANYLGVKYAISVANGSDALRLSVQALDVKKRWLRYYYTVYLFFATASSIVLNQATPIFVDIEEDFYNIDLDQVEKVLQTHPKKEHIKGIIPVHLFGKTIDLERLEKKLEIIIKYISLKIVLNL